MSDENSKIAFDEKRKRINEKRGERRRRRIEEDPEYLARECEKRRERRRRRIEENPEYLARESKKRKERRHREDPESHKKRLLLNQLKRENQHREILNAFFDRLFEENKHTFPNPISIRKWENLKRDYLNFLFSDMFSPGDNTLKELLEDRKKYIVMLQENPNFHCAASIIFQIKTLVPYAKDNTRKLTQSEIDWVNSLDASSPEKIKKSYGQKEYKREKSKEYYQKKQMNQKTHNLNLRFMKADPNKVLSIDEITNDPFVSNFPIREQHKIDLWKADENLEDLEKWRKQYEDYVLEVEKLSIEYKENFLK